jgi:hypothetical protein
MLALIKNFLKFRVAIFLAPPLQGRLLVYITIFLMLTPQLLWHCGFVHINVFFSDAPPVLRASGGN